jgi:hypothetical protein
MQAGYKHTVALLSVAILLVIVVPVVVYMSTRDNAPTNTNTTITNVTTNGGTNAGNNVNTVGTTPVEQGQAFYIAEKTGKTVTVFTQDANTADRTELFHYREGSTYATGSDNSYESLTPSITYNSTTDTFAYASEDGLFTYEASTGTITPLITKTSSPDPDDEGLRPQSPTWSNDTVSGVYFFIFPQYSADGLYLSFSGALYEGMYTYVMDTATGGLTFVDTEDNTGISGYNISWALEGHDFVIARPFGYGAMGIFTATHSDFDALNEILHADQNEAQAFTAFFTEDRHIAYTYQANTRSDEFYEPSTYRLAIINEDGSGQADLVADDTNNVAEATDGNTIVYHKQNPNDKTENGLWVYDIDTGTNTQLAIQKTNHRLVTQSFKNNLVTYIDYDDEHNTALLYFVNPDTLDASFASTLLDDNSVLYYMSR